MNDLAERALLPAGLRDILPPFAAFEAEIVSRLMAVFAGHGYERVKPPMIEFEQSLGGEGAFRVMDPLTQRMMRVRNDMTPQVARIAATRLANDPRPLRLAYAGQVLQVKGSQLRAERQFGQVGVELIGATDSAADAEILALCLESLEHVGLSGITVDLTLSKLVPAIIGQQNDDSWLRNALDHRDVTAVSAAGGDTAKLLTALIEAVGPADRALARLQALELPAAAQALRSRLVEVVALIRAALPDLTLTIDPVETRGFEYHTGVGFTIFARHSAAEIGRGGRYLAHGEPAVGATLFMDTVMEILPKPEGAKRLYVPAGSDRALAASFRNLGWVTINGLAAADDVAAEARRLRCSHVLQSGSPKEISNG
jgi:ATP phosphoribosyltransferase regulatory subunit